MTVGTRNFEFRILDNIKYRKIPADRQRIPPKDWVSTRLPNPRINKKDQKNRSIPDADFNK
jgi:hypothetical protein